MGRIRDPAFGMGGVRSWGVTYREIRERTCLLRIVEAISAVWWRVFCKPVVHSCGLVVGNGEDVAEASTGVDDCFACFFGLRAGGEGFGDVGVVLDLECDELERYGLEMVESG